MSLWSELSGGSEKAYQEFAADFGCKFERWLKWNGFTHADAIDVAEDGTVYVLLRLDRYRPEEPVQQKFLAWAWRVARNYAEDWRRKNRPDLYEPLEEPPPRLNGPARPDPIEVREEKKRDEEAAEDRESNLRKLLSQLPEKLRKVVL